MKKLFELFSVCYLLGLLISCVNEGQNIFTHPYVGTFSVNEGITFTLNNDSTTYIDFGDGVNYESTWEIVKEDGEEWANIEFSGNNQYYYLKNGKLYRSRMEMDYDKYGSKVTYQD